MIDLIEALVHEGIDCRVVVPRDGHVAKALEPLAVPYVVSHFRTWCNPWSVPLWDRALKKPLLHASRALRLAHRIRDWRCDVVVTNTLTVCEGALAARVLGIPHVTHVREFGDLDHGWQFEIGARRSMRVLSALSRRVIFNSQAVARHYEREVPAERARVVYNAVPVPSAWLGKRCEADRRRSDGAFRCVLVGTVTKSKGPEEALLALRETRRRGLPVKLRIVGGGHPAYMARLRALIGDLQVGSDVELVGPVRDPYSFFNEADVALMCSRMEAFGRVTVEAMKLGTPVIGAASGGTPEAIRDGFNGLLYKPGDPRHLADKIQTLCENREVARQMGCRAAEWANETFRPSRYAQEVLAVLHEATQRR
jgi:glycosyltransferase involved in cell wall biosynthesis